MIDLGVNIDHVATLRQARKTRYPDPIEAAQHAEHAGADAITLHLREDRRHIQDHDVERLRPLLITRMNLECAVVEPMLAIACRVLPHDVCLVPEKREEITTEGGLDVVHDAARIRDAVTQLGEAGIRVSLFIDPEPRQIEAAAAVGAPVIEIHTGRYADAADPAARAHELGRVAAAVDAGLRAGLKVNAGHGLNYDNVAPVAALLGITELNIGHAIVGHALFAGWENAVRQMKAIMTGARVRAMHA